MQSDKVPATGEIEQGHECLSWVVLGAHREYPSVRCVPKAEVNLGILNVCYGGTRNLDFIADSIDRRQICGMLRAIVNNIKGVI